MTMDLARFYDGKRVVVTGGSGMVGHQLVKLLLRTGSDVIVLDTEVRGKQRIDGARYFRPDLSDATEIPFMEYVFGGESPKGEPVDMVFNLAASVGGVIHNLSHRIEMLKENMLLQVNPVIAAERAGVESFLQCSSVCIYGPEYNHPALEEYGLDGMPHAANFGYAWSKRIGEMMALGSDIPFVVTARPSNTFGVHDYFDSRSHVIPAIINRVLEDSDEVVLFGNPEFKREFIYSTDVALGMMYAMAKGDDRQAYNLGCNGQNVVSIRQLAMEIMDIMDVSKDIVVKRPDDGGDPIRYSDTTKMFSETGWTHSVSLREGLEKVIAWRMTQLGQ